MAARRVDPRGVALAAFGAIAFSGKAIIVKLGYRHGVDAVTLLGLACMGTYERLMGTVNASIFIAIGIESVLGFLFLMVFMRRSDKP